MTTMDTRDHTIAFNTGGTWVELSEFEEVFGVDVLEIEKAVGELRLDWIGEDLTNRAMLLIQEELIDIFGEPVNPLE